MSGPRNKAERLALAGAVAPFLRDQSERAASRRVTRVDKDGNVVGYTTLAEVQQGLLRRHEIEIDVAPDERPREFFCQRCGLPSPMPERGAQPKHCSRCERYVRGLGRKTRDALGAKKLRGERVGQIPYGYKLGPDGVHLEEDPEEQAVIAAVRLLHRTGFSHRGIVRELAARGVVSRSGKPLGLTQVQRFLRTRSA